MTARLARLLVPGLAPLLACVGPFAPADDGADEEAVYYGYYRPDRRDYVAFRASHPDLLEPNYLPFMLHRLPGDPVTGDDLVFCRWSESRMPIDLHIEPPVLSDAVQDEFTPVPPEAFVAAVESAVLAWEEALEGHVRFRWRKDPAEADLRIRILGEQAPTPEPDKRVLGFTPGLTTACRATGWNPVADELRVRFEVPQFSLYVADEYGLLTLEQVRRVAMHELGHALGMSGHSPVSTDLMYRTLGEDLTVDTLSLQDLNSFLSLYELPNGAHYGKASPEPPPPRPPPLPPTGAPVLAMSPHVDGIRGFEIQIPAGWLRVPTAHGFFASNGPLWDYDASLEIFVWPAPTLEAFVERFGELFFQGGWLRFRSGMIVNGRRALRVLLEEPDGRAAEFTLIEVGDGRTLLLLAHSPSAARVAWHPWFQASLATLEIWD